MQNMRGESDSRSRVALRGFSQNLPLGNLGKLLDDLRAQMIVGQNPDTFRRQNRPQAIDGLLDQRAVAEKFQDLLGVGPPAARPEPRPAAAGENQPIANVTCLIEPDSRAPASMSGPSVSW